MTPPAMNERQRFWLRHYACRAFQHAIESCHFLLRYGIHPESPLYYPLMTAAYVTYSRPFMSNFGVGRLDDSFIPAERLADHKHIMSLRSTFYAHSDAIEPPSSNQPSNAIIVFAKDGELQFALHEMKTLPPGLPLVIDMSRLLLAKAHDEAEEIAAKIGLKANIPDGVYHLNLGDEPAPLLVPANV